MAYAAREHIAPAYGALTPGQDRGNLLGLCSVEEGEGNNKGEP